MKEEKEPPKKQDIPIPLQQISFEATLCIYVYFCSALVFKKVEFPNCTTLTPIKEMIRMANNLINFAEAFGGDKTKLVVDAGTKVANKIKGKREEYERRVSLLEDSLYDMSWKYIKAILNNFVQRKIRFYGGQTDTTIQALKTEIEHPKHSRPRPIILIGRAGIGKSTALKWLFLNSYATKYEYVYLRASQFKNCNSLETVLAEIKNILSGKEKCIVFFDGLDELACVHGTTGELDLLLDFFDGRGDTYIENANHRFVVSTRPEHFDFYQYFQRKQGNMGADRYQLYEFLPLTADEAFRVCKSIKKLNQVDSQELGAHFRDKWPSKDGHSPLTERQYLRRLKQYLQQTDYKNSQLTSPLLCRYAYQVICEWEPKSQTEPNTQYLSQSSSIRLTLGAYIKWEFHDSYKFHAGGGEGKIQLEKYKTAVFDFLTDVAEQMGTDNDISKEQWLNLKKDKKLGINSALCVLYENDHGQYSFIHQSFQEYFLARCLVLKSRRSKVRSQLEALLKSNLEFALMYVEQLAEIGTALEKRICSHILNQEAEDKFERLLEYALGGRHFLWKPDVHFSVEDYFKVFPNGVCKYAGTIFTLDRLNKLRETGTLETPEADYIAGRSPSDISKKIRITAIQMHQGINSVFVHTTTSFQCFCQERICPVGGFWSRTYKSDEILRILERQLLQGSISQERLTSNELLHNEVISSVYQEKRRLDFKRKIKERLTLYHWITQCAQFLGSKENYWCLFDGETLHTYQMTPENESKICALFQSGFQKRYIDYLSLYGEYRALTEAKETLLEKFALRHIQNIQVVFDSSKSIQQNKNLFHEYYRVHWKNAQLFERKREKRAFFQGDGQEQDIYLVREILEIFVNAERDPEFLQSEKLQLCYSDERLLTYYLMEEGDRMVELAENTMELCKKYCHEKGILLRTFLINEDTTFNGADFEELQKFTNEYIWI